MQNCNYRLWTSFFNFKYCLPSSPIRWSWNSTTSSMTSTKSSNVLCLNLSFVNLNFKHEKAKDGWDWVLFLGEGQIFRHQHTWVSENEAVLRHLHRLLIQGEKCFCSGRTPVLRRYWLLWYFNWITSEFLREPSPPIWEDGMWNLNLSWNVGNLADWDILILKVNTRRKNVAVGGYPGHLKHTRSFALSEVKKEREWMFLEWVILDQYHVTLDFLGKCALGDWTYFKSNRS
jgi:hypothetical protein